MREYQAKRRAEKKAEREAAERAAYEERVRQADEQLSLEPMQQQDIAEQVVKKKRGLKPASLDANFTGTQIDIRNAILNATRYIKAEPCKSDNEVADRIELYFNECAEYGIIPKWETLALALGITRAAIWKWATGQSGSPARQRMVQRAKDILSAVDAELVQTGKVNPVVYIFRAKNFYDMKDTQDVVITPNQPLGEMQSPEELADKYSTLIELDDE